jgi:transposase
MSPNVEREASILALVHAGVSHAKTAKRLGVTRNVVSGVVLRWRNREARKLGVWAPRPRPIYEPMVATYEITASKEPFASDSSCPDFAWDDAHCEAVLALGGFKSIEDYRRAA